MEHSTPNAYTAAQIARALGKNRQTVQKFVAGIPASTQIPVNGCLAKAWSFHALPCHAREELARLVARKGYRDVEHLLSAPCERWEPPIPLNRIEQRWIEKALKLQEALRHSLTVMCSPDAPSADFEAIGLVEYQTRIGPISGRHWRRKIEKVIERDRGNEDFGRIEIYLDDAAFCASGRPLPKSCYSHVELEDDIAQLETRATPTGDDKAALYDAAFVHFEQLCREHPGEDRQIKTSLLAFLLSRVPAISRNADSLRWTFTNKYQAWIASGKKPSALQDKRSLFSGRLQSDFQKDKETITSLAIQFGGNVARAQREAVTRGLLSPEYVQHFNLNFRRHKSYVPETIREEVAAKAEMAGPYYRGERQAILAGPYINRSHDDYFPGDWFSADDLTIPVYFRSVDSAGEPIVTRGECLVKIDLRTGYILGYVLIAGKYNSRHIRGLMLRVHDEHGLPRKGLYYENGIWKARLIAGADKRSNVPWRETEMGLREFGIDLQLRHARLPRAKTIEGIFGILQDRMEIEPGYVGRNEQVEVFERTQKYLRLARGGVLEALTKLYTHEEMCRVLDVVIKEFNDDPQNGKMLTGKAPAEAWMEHIANHPLRKLPDDARFLLSSHKRVVMPGRNGITIKTSKHSLLFYNEQTGKLPLNQPVLVWWHIEHPHLITVTDMKRQNPFVVRAHVLPATTATKEQFNAARADQAGHLKEAKALYGNIAHNLISTISRDTDHGPTTKQLGRFNRAAIEEIEAEESARDRTISTIRTEAAKLGSRIDLSAVKNEKRVLEGLRLQAEARAEMEMELQKKANK